MRLTLFSSLGPCFVCSVVSRWCVVSVAASSSTWPRSWVPLSMLSAEFDSDDMSVYGDMRIQLRLLLPYSAALGRQWCPWRRWWRRWRRRRGGVGKGSETGPMMGDTPSGVVARRTLSVEWRRLRVSDPRPYRHHLHRTIRRSVLHLSGAAPGSPEVGSRMVQGRSEAESGVGGFFHDKTDSTITIEDSGVSFSKNELVINFGTIAQSDTKAFLVAMSAGGDILGCLGLASFRPIWFGQGSCRQQETMKTNSTSGSRRPVSPSPCRKTPRLCTGRSCEERRSFST